MLFSYVWSILLAIPLPYYVELNCVFVWECVSLFCCESKINNCRDIYHKDDQTFVIQMNICHDVMVLNYGYKII